MSLLKSLGNEEALMQCKADPGGVIKGDVSGGVEPGVACVHLHETCGGLCCFINAVCLIVFYFLQLKLCFIFCGFLCFLQT